MTGDRVDIREHQDGKMITVEIHYTAHFKLLFFDRTEQVVLRNDFTNLGL